MLHLSEHHGDGTPGTIVYIATTGVRELHTELSAKDYPNLRPGLTDEIGTCLQLLDPFGNTLRFKARRSDGVTTRLLAPNARTERHQVSSAGRAISAPRRAWRRPDRAICVRRQTLGVTMAE
jgi:Glyoxalase superfamily protein